MNPEGRRPPGSSSGAIAQRSFPSSDSKNLRITAYICRSELADDVDHLAKNSGRSDRILAQGSYQVDRSASRRWVTLMRLTLPTDDRSARQELPGELYIGFVDSLLVEVRSLFFACTASVAAALVAAIASRSAALWACAVLMLLLSVVRMHFQMVHAKNRPSPNIEVARRREAIFVAGATAHIALLSTWTLVAFAVTDEGFVRFLATTVTVTYAFGMWTRSFALDRGMNTQLAAAFVPLSAAFLIGGGWYPSMIVISLLPVFLFIKSSSNRLKGIFRAEIAERNRQRHAGRAARHRAQQHVARPVHDRRQGRLILANDQVLPHFRPRTRKPNSPERTRAPSSASSFATASIDEASFVPLSYAVFGKRTTVRISSCRSRPRTSARSKSPFQRMKRRRHRHGHPGRHRAPQRPARDQPHGALRLRHRAAQSPMLRGGARSGASLATAPRATA